MDLLKEQGVKDGDVLHVNELLGVDVFIDNEKYVWHRNREVIAVQLKNEVA